MKVILSTLAAALLFAGTAGARDIYETETLFREKKWQVDLTHDAADGTLWCSAETRNRVGQTFSLTAYEGGGLVLFVFDPGWSIARRPVDFLVDVDYSRWTMAGTGNGISVSIGLDEPKKNIAFLSELQAAHAVAVMNAEGRRLATFSLAGSGAGIEALMACWSSILAPGRDPADPFVTASDPFS